jgi:hypothetical protein
LNKLDEFAKEEWWDICRKLRPDITREQFEIDWREFHLYKTAKALH